MRTMNNLISRKTAIDAFKKWFWESLFIYPSMSLDEIEKFELLLYRFPVEQKGRNKGRWIPVTKLYRVEEDDFPKTYIEWVDATEPDEVDAVRCSACGEVFDFESARNYCSNCGAIMDGGSDG